ncbi:hypothetical protein CR513_19714, partial [Mucuna pruriens]
MLSQDHLKLDSATIYKNHLKLDSAMIYKSIKSLIQQEPSAMVLVLIYISKVQKDTPLPTKKCGWQSERKSN